MHGVQCAFVLSPAVAKDRGRKSCGVAMLYVYDIVSLALALSKNIPLRELMPGMVVVAGAALGVTRHCAKYGLRVAGAAGDA